MERSLQERRHGEKRVIYKPRSGALRMTPSSLWASSSLQPARKCISVIEAALAAALGCGGLSEGTWGEDAAGLLPGLWGENPASHPRMQLSREGREEMQDGILPATCSHWLVHGMTLHCSPWPSGSQLSYLKTKVLDRITHATRALL